jgi:hypothetical protein
MVRDAEVHSSSSSAGAPASLPDSILERLMCCQNLPLLDYLYIKNASVRTVDPDVSIAAV